jgi:hypothetical protein
MRGGKPSELTRLKLLWRDSMQEPVRDYWRSLLYSDTTQADIRVEIKAKLDINLLYDKQLTEFRDWEWTCRQRDLEADRMAADEASLKQLHGDWTLDQVREELLKIAYARSIATGDFKLGLSTMDRDLTLKDGTTRAAQKERSLAQKDAQIKLDQAKFQRAVVEKTLDAAMQAKAKEVASSGASKSDQIEALGQAMFGEDWAD